MPYSFQKLPGEPIVVLCIDRALSSREEGTQMGKEIGDALAQCGEYMHLILDYSTLDMSFGVIIMSLAAALIADGEKVIKMSDPRLHIRVVGDNILAKLWVTAMRQQQYGNNPALLFETVDEAILDARKEEAQLTPQPVLEAEEIA